MFELFLKSCVYLSLEIYPKNTKTDLKGKKCSRGLFSNPFPKNFVFEKQIVFQSEDVPGI